MRPRQSFRLKPIGAFRNGATTGLWFASLLLAVSFLVWLFLFMRRHEARLEQEAEQAIPGPLTIG